MRRLLFLTTDTAHSTELYGRPPFPYDEVASSMRFVQEPNSSGQFMSATGLDGLLAVRVLRNAVGDARFKTQLATEPEQKALRRSAISVTVLPGMRYT